MKPIITLPPDYAAPVRSPFYTTLAEAEKVMASLNADNGGPVTAQMSLRVGTQHELSSEENAHPEDGRRGWFITWSQVMQVNGPLTFGRTLELGVPFVEIAGELLTSLEGAPNGKWLLSVADATTAENVSQLIGDVERQ